MGDFTPGASTFTSNSALEEVWTARRTSNFQPVSRKTYSHTKSSGYPADTSTLVHLSPPIEKESLNSRID